MSRLSIIDARPDQLKILKLERRQLRGLAKTLLTKNTSRPFKAAAIAAAAVSIIALHDAPAAFVQKIGAETGSLAGSIAVREACAACGDLAQLVENDAGEDEVSGGLARLFAIVDSEHARLDTFARAAGARLLRVYSEPDIGDGGGNKTLTSWLTQHMTSAH